MSRKTRRLRWSHAPQSGRVVPTASIPREDLAMVRTWRAQPSQPQLRAEFERRSKP